MFFMNPGDILLFKAEKDILSRLIAWGTDSLYSHVAICVNADLDIAIEAMTRGGVRARDIKRITGMYDVFRVRPENQYDLNKTLAYLVKQLNNNYDYQGVIYLGILKLVSKIYRPVKNVANKWQKKKDYFCSELCYEAFCYGGLDIVPQVDEAAITSPGDISRSPVLLHIRG